LAALLLISIGVLFVGIAGSLALMLRSGETRVGLLTLCLALLATRQGIALRQFWDAPLALDATGAAEISLLVACGIGATILAALWRTLAERDRAESVHWNSMESVRVLGELAARFNLSLDQKLDALLKIGRERFDLEIGVISKVDKQRYEVVAIGAQAGFPVSRGAVFLLADTCCGRAITSERPVAFERVDESDQPENADRAPFGFRAYLGGSIRIYGEVFGTLCFGSRSPRRRCFTATDKDLLNLMSQWVGTELERCFAVEEREANARRAEAIPAAPVRAGRAELSIPRSTDVNAAIRRSDKNLRNLIGPDIELEYRLADDLQAAVRLRVTVGVVVESLVLKAVEALSADAEGRLTIETMNLEVANPDPDVIPAVTPDHYVTIAVTASGNRIEAESLTRAFEPDPEGAETTKRWEIQKHMTVAAIFRLLQRCGGDLSLEVEPGKGSTFTVFLPRAAADSATPRPSPARASSPRHT